MTCTDRISRRRAAPRGAPRGAARAALRAPASLLLALLLVSVGCAGPAASTQPAQFDLARAVPDDVFLVTGSRHNAERQFLDDNWCGVFDRLMESGVPQELLELVLGLADEGQRAEFERLHVRFADLIGAVDWAALGKGQFVFAERLPAPLSIGGGPAIVMQPDMLFLLRTDPELARASHAQLVALLEAAVDEISKLADEPLQVRSEELHGVPFAVFDLLQAAREAPVMPLSIGRYEDVLVIGFGNDMAECAAALLTGLEGRRSIADDPRFRAAFAGLPTPDDGFEFVDMQRLRDDLRQIADNILGLVRSATSGSFDDHITNVGQDAEGTQLRNLGYAAYQQGDYERALKLTEAAYEVEPGDTLALYNMACMHALLGRKEQACEWLGRAVAGGFHAPRQIRDDVDLDDLRDEPAYLAALAAAREGARAHDERGLQAAESIVGRVLSSLGVLDYSATVHRTAEHASWSDSLAVLTADASGEPIHAVLAGARPMRPFLQRLPAETVSFSVSGGMDLEPMYAFAEATLAESGPVGERVLTEWSALQEQWGLRLREDLLAPLGSEMISAQLSVDGRAAWVWMLSVDDEQAVAEQLGRLLDNLPRWMSKAAAEAPMLAMLALRTQPTSHADLPGYREVVLGIAQAGMLCGVSDGWLICADSAATVRLMRETEAGRHPDVRTNAALVRAALLPDAPALRVSFTDHGDAAAKVADGLRAASMMGGMVGAAISDPDAQQALTRVLSMLSRLAPVVESIDFFDSSAAFTTFDGRAWHTRSVTRYVPPHAGN